MRVMAGDRVVEDIQDRATRVPRLELLPRFGPPRRAPDQASRPGPGGVVFEGQRPVGPRHDEPGRLLRAGPDADLSAPRVGPSELDQQALVGMLPRRVPRGRHRLDLAEQGTHDIDGPGEDLPRQVPPLPVRGRLVPEGAEGPDVLALHRPAKRLDPRMQAEREVGHQHGPRLRAAERDLVIGLGVGAGRVQADRRQPHRRHPPQRLGAEFRLPADDDRLDPRRRQRIVQVARLRHVGPFLETGEGRPEPVLGVLGNPTGPGSFLGPASQDQEVHRHRTSGRVASSSHSGLDHHIRSATRRTPAGLRAKPAVRARPLIGHLGLRIPNRTVHPATAAQSRQIDRSHASNSADQSGDPDILHLKPTAGPSGEPLLRDILTLREYFSPF